MGSLDPMPNRWTRFTRSVYDHLNYRKAYNYVKVVAKNHGWKIAAAVAIIEIAEHFILPGVLVSIGYPHFVVLGGIPIAEFTVYPLLFKALGGNFT
jgi:hypothetical protein